MQINHSSSTHIARFGRGAVIYRSHTPIAESEMQRIAPSIFASTKHESRSDRFAHIPTNDVLRGLAKEGFLPFEVRQGGSKDDEKRGFTKHLVRLRHNSQSLMGDSFREIILLNAHDGTSSYRMMSGLFRMVCSNGLVTCEGEMQDIRIAHKGNVTDQVVDAAYRIIDDAQNVHAQLEDMRGLTLSTDEQNAFAVAAAELRFDEGKNPLAAHQILRARRADDQGADLWRTFNRVQENLVKGDLHYMHRNPATRQVSSRSTRPVQSIDGNVTLNRALWRLASEMQKIKQAA